MKILYNLTPLRFILASLVVLYHIPLFCQKHHIPFCNSLAIFDKGMEAVYMFFALSGFLIVRQLYLEKSETNTINLKNFFSRRMLRIFPLYYLVLIFGLIYYRVILPSLGYELDNSYDLLAGVGLAVTLFANVFATYHPGGILEVLWSIGIEEQFYLFIAPVIFVLPFKKIVPFLVLFTVVYFCFFALENFAFLRKYQMLFFYFSFSGLCSILALQTDFAWLKKLKYIFLIIFILYFTTPIFRDAIQGLIPYHLFSMVLFGVTISLFIDSPIKLLENKPMVYLGKISFGIYMLHSIMIQFTGLVYIRYISKLNLSDIAGVIIFNLTVFTFTIWAAHLSYRYFEGYFLRMKKKFKTV